MIGKFEELTFQQLSRANCARLPLFLNAKGAPAHEEDDGSDWTPSDWMLATLGELGEAANKMKKVMRGDMPMYEAREAIADELADTVIYLDILAAQMSISLGRAVAKKWNAKSKELGIGLRIEQFETTDHQGRTSL